MCLLQKQVRMVTKQVQGQTVWHQIIEYMCALSSLFTCYTWKLLYLVLTLVFSSSCSLSEHQPVPRLPQIQFYLIWGCGREYFRISSSRKNINETVINIHFIHHKQSEKIWSKLTAHVRMWQDHVPHGFILQSDWFLKLLRGNGRQKIHRNATRHLFRCFGRGLGTRLQSKDTGSSTYSRAVILLVVAENKHP